MLAASIGICLFMVLVGVLAPARWKPFVFGAMLPMGDFLAVPGPVPISGTLFGFVCMMLVCYRASPLNVLRQFGTLTGALLLGLIFYDLLAIWFAGTIFSGHFLAMPNDAMARVELAQPVGLVKANLNQLFYLVVGCAMPLSIQAHYEQKSPLDAIQSLDGLMTGLALSSTAFVMWQLAGQHGVPYPDDLIHIGSRAGAFDQEIAGVKRLAGSYSEPSTLGGTVGLTLCYLLSRSPVSSGWRLRFLAIMGSIISLTLSTSTSGLIMLFFAFVIGGLSFFLRLITASNKSAGSRIGREIAVFTPLAGIVGVGALLIFSLPQTRNVLYAILINKSRTSSFAERAASNELAANLFAQTTGLGVGLGGHVASSGFLTLAADLGIVGYAIIGYFVVRSVLLPLHPPPVNTRDAVASREAQVSLCALALGYLAVMTIAASPFVGLLLWFQVGFASVLWRSSNSKAKPSQWRSRASQPVGAIARR